MINRCDIKYFFQFLKEVGYIDFFLNNYNKKYFIKCIKSNNYTGLVYKSIPWNNKNTQMDYPNLSTLIMKQAMIRELNSIWIKTSMKYLYKK